MKRLFAFVVVLALASAALAQDIKSQVLRPPAGYKVALVAFEDLQCPDCGRAEPLLEEAVNTYHIPLVRHDFPLPMHPWAFQAAVLARYFDTQSLKLGEEFRRAVYKNQASISLQNLRPFAENFARAHNLELPFLVDPEGKLTAEVNKDRDLGLAVGIDHTPTIYVVTSKRQSDPFVEVVDRSNLFAIIEQGIQQAGGTRTAEKSPRRRTAAEKK
jgi:protein-disulfide isomerase